MAFEIVAIEGRGLQAPVSQSSIRLAPDGFAGYRNLGVAYYTQGDLAKAAAQFRRRGPTERP